MGKNRRIKSGGTKNQNKCSVFQAAYKLDYLHTDFILKHLTQSPTNPTKSPLSPIHLKKSQYRPQYRKTYQNQHFHLSNTANLKPKSKSLSSYINIKIPRKSTFSPINNFSLKITSIT